MILGFEHFSLQIREIEKNCLLIFQNQMISKLDFKSGELGQNARKSSPVGIGGYEITSHTNKSLLKVR
jgi:hypothetical protein